MSAKFTLNTLPETELDGLGNQLKSGKIGVIPTDTIYGIVGSALNQKTVEKIYELRKRSKDKPMIILISGISDLDKFNIKLSPKQLETLTSIWPNPVSIVLPCDLPQFTYLHRGKKSLAFRYPNLKFLQKLLSISGPLVAPSANFEGDYPSLTIKDAEKYFDDTIDFYLDTGPLSSNASTVATLTETGFQVLRQGDFKLKHL